MMTFARFDNDRAQLVIQVWDAELHFTVLLTKRIFWFPVMR